MMPRLSIIAPLFNEEENVAELCRRCLAAADQTGLPAELILVDDGSRDNTLPLIEGLCQRDARIRFISFTRNFGHQAALFAGLEHASGTHIVLMDGDLQDPPERIPELLARSREGYDVVYAKRTARQGESWMKRSTAALFYRLINRLTRFPIPLDTGDFRLITRPVARELLRMNDPRKFLRGQVAWLGFRETHVTFERPARHHGRSGYGPARMFRLALDGITSFSHFPLRLASISGLLVSALSFALILYVLWAKFVWGDTITGWASLMVTVLFLGGIQLLSLGIIGEYISRINESVRQRQLYVVEKSNLSNPSLDTGDDVLGA